MNHSTSKTRLLRTPSNLLRIGAEPLPLIIFIGVIFIGIELLYFIQFRKVNLDEGWYLWASKLVYEGRLLYSDFTYTQTPLLPYVYGLWQQVAGESLMAGRILTALFGLATTTVGALIVKRRLEQRQVDRVKTGVVTFLLLFATSLFTLVYLSYTATYGLAAFLMMASLFFALDDSTLENSKSHTARNDFLTMAFLGLAVATRLSIAPALPILILYRIWRSANKWRTIVCIGLALGIGGIMLTGLFLTSGSQMIYDIFGFHTDRTPSMVRQFWRMVETTRNTGFAYAVPLLIICVGICVGIAGGIVRAIRSLSKRQQLALLLRRNDFEIAVLIATFGIFLLHLWPRTTDAYYNTLLLPVWGILAALVVAKLRVSTPIITIAILINLILQTVMLQRNDLLQLPPINQLAVVNKAAQFLGRIDKQDNQVLTLNTHLALESGMRVPYGYEMSIFSYRPDWSNEQVAQFHVVNNQRLIADLAAGVDAVAVTDFDLERFYGERQEIFDTLNSHYRLAKTVPVFDPFYNNLYIYLPPQFTELVPDTSLVVALENGISLLGYEGLQSTYQPGDEILVAVYWTSTEQLALSYTVFIHLFDETGTVVSGWDNPPCRTTCPTTSWRAGEILRDEYTMPVPADVAPGSYRLRVGMYHSDSGTNVMAVTQREHIQDGRLIILDEVMIE